MANHYELLYLVPTNYTEEELTPIKEKIKNLIKKFEGEITLEDSFGKKKLAYPIKGNYQGYYLLYEFDLNGENLKKLSQELKLTNEVLRHIIVKRSLKIKAKSKTEEQRIKPVKTEISVGKKEEADKGKIKLEDLDKKLDEILKGDIM